MEIGQSVQPQFSTATVQHYNYTPSNQIKIRLMFTNGTVIVETFSDQETVKVSIPPHIRFMGGGAGAQMFFCVCKKGKNVTYSNHFLRP